MADSKYGRLFTQRDLERLIDWVTGGTGEPGDATALNRFEQEIGPFTFPADEPLFLLRGQDKAAPSAICNLRINDGQEDYYDYAAELGATEAFLKGIRAEALRIRNWQDAHPTRVKVPD